MRAREFLREEEYDDGAGQFGQNPDMQKFEVALANNPEMAVA